MIYRGPGFLAVVCVGSPPPESSTGGPTEKLRKRYNLLTGEGGGEEEPKHMTARKPGPL
jgi:hypothetical protein